MTESFKKPAELHEAIKAAQPYGQGVLKRLGIHIFAATLWTDAGIWSMDKPFALSIRYGRSFGAYDLVEKSLADMNRLEKLEPSMRRAYAAALEALFRDVRRDDVITALYDPWKGASFFYNGVLTGVAEDVLARRFLDIWFSPRASEPALRDALLALR